MTKNNNMRNESYLKELYAIRASVDDLIRVMEREDSTPDIEIEF